MKKLLLSAASFFILGSSFAQQTQLYLEDFEGTLNVTNGIGGGAGVSNWFLSSTFPNGSASYTSPTHCYRDTVPPGPALAYSYFTTDPFDCSGSGYVAFQFNHICKIPPAQRATIEVSVNGGSVWTPLDGTYYKTNFYRPGSSPFFPTNGYFSSIAYPAAWFPGTATRIPDSTWWRNEAFDISALAAFQPDVRIRFKLTNQNGTGTGTREYGWLVDDIDVQVAPDAPPLVYLASTNAGSFTLGPFHFLDSIPATGINCCNVVTMYWTVNGGPVQNIVMTNPAANLWTCTIPAVNDLDTVCYYFQALNWNNVEGYFPAAFNTYTSAGDPFNIPGAVNCFVASSGIHFPYCEQFNNSDGGWTSDTLQPGSDWQWGIPNVGITSGAFSFPKCWDVDLHAKYVSNTHAYLYSPLFTLTTTTSNIKLSFWRNHNAQNARDGFRLEYDFNQSGVYSRLGDIGDPKGTNWYDTTVAGSGTPPKPGWTGNTGTWIQSEYFLQQFIGQAGNIQFRFVFDSDNFGNLDGVSIDDFCMVVPPPKDAQMLAILKPGSSSPSGVLDSVRVRLRNVGSTTMRNVPPGSFKLRYIVTPQVGPPIVVTEDFTAGDSITPAEIKEFAFTQMFTVPAGSYGICAYTILASDADHTNDTVCKTSVGVPLKQLPYKDNFDGASIWYDSSNVGATSHWEWGTPGYGVTNSAYSPPNAWDINLISAYTQSQSCVLITPLFDLTNKSDVTMRFWQNRNVVEGEDGMRIEYTTTGGGNDTDWHILDTVGANLEQQNWYTNYVPPLDASGRPGWSANSFGWKESKMVLRELDSAGAAVQFRFIFSSYVSTPLDGISIDNFSLKAISDTDMGVVEVIHPDIKGVAGDADLVTVVIKNYGKTPLASCPLRFRVNNGAFTSPVETWSSIVPLETYETDTFTFAAPYIVPSSYYDLCAYTVLASDKDHDNDTSCNRPFGIPRKTLTFADNFDTGPQNWVGVSVDNVTQWELGAPNYGVTSSAHSNPTAWDINLISEYKKNADAQLYSPIFNFSNQYNARLKFWHNWSVQNKRDGVKLEYKTNLLDTVWTLLDTLGNLYIENWYNDSSNFAPLKPANWTGASAGIPGNANGWIESKMILSVLDNAGPDVQFRFVFLSDATTNGSGYTMDDFSITKSPDADAAGITILNPRQIGIAGDTDTLKVLVFNAGNLPITSMSLGYSINNVPQTPVAWAGNILPGDSLYIAVGPMVIPHLAYTLCFYPVVANDGDHTNDTICVDLFGAAKFNISYFDSLNTFPQEFFILDPPASAGGTNEWEFGIPISAAIQSACSPPYCWKTKINGNHSANRNDYLYTPFFDMHLAYKAEMRFCINYKTEPGNDGGRIDYSLDTGKTWQPLGLSGDGLGTNWFTTNALSTTNKPAWEGNSQGWQNAVYKLNVLQYSPGLVSFRFHYSANSGGNNEGMAIDNFEIYNPYRFNVAPIAFDSLPNPFDMNGLQTIKVFVQNRGSIDLSKYTITLTSDGVPVVTDVVTLPTPLVYQGITSHVMSQFWNPDLPALGGHDLCAYTSLPNDSTDLYMLDDTLCIIAGRFDSVTVDNGNPQYCNNFDSTMTKWIPVNSYTQTIRGSNWMHGTPNKSTINTNYSGTESWVTRLTGNYDDIDSSALYSPVFAVDSDGCYQVSFYHNFQMEDYQDGGVVEYSLDAGVTWHTLGYGFEQNWYNSVFITSLSRDTSVLGVAGWTGSSFGSWVYASHNVKFYNPALAIFRFRFGSDPSKTMEGWAMDNFCLQKIGPCTIGINEIDETGFAIAQNFPNPASQYTSFSYLIPSRGKVRLFISDILGQEIMTVVDETQAAGQYMHEVNVSSLATGVYYYTLEFEGKRLNGKMIVID